MNCTNSITSAESPNCSRIFASACEVFSFERSSKRNARCSVLRRSSLKPFRSKPIELMPKLFVSRSVTTRENGGTSCVITVHAPSDENRPHAANLMHGRERSPRLVIFNCHMPRQRRRIRKNIVAADLRVVPDVRIRHQQIVVADLRDTAALFRPTAHRYALPKRILIT